MRSLRPLLFAVFAFLFCWSAILRADVALLVEDPAGYKGFWSDSGHLAIWITDACVGDTGVVSPCLGGSGAVLSSTSYWSRRGWAAIPAQTYLEGIVGKEDSIAWSDTLHTTYPLIPVSFGRKYVGRLDHRGSYVIRIHTTPEQDRRVLEQIQLARDKFRYAVFSNNCSDFARQVLELYFPGRFRRRVIPDFGISTPHGVANRFAKLGRKQPELDTRIYYIPRRTSAGRLHDGRTKGICEAAITDVKYALPLVFYQPMIYAAFGVCYLTTDQPAFMRRGFARNAHRVGSLAELNLEYEFEHRPQIDLLGYSTANALQTNTSAGLAAAQAQDGTE